MNLPGIWEIFRRLLTLLFMISIFGFAFFGMYKAAHGEVVCAMNTGEPFGSFDITPEILEPHEVWQGFTVTEECSMQNVYVQPVWTTFPDSNAPLIVDIYDITNEENFATGLIEADEMPTGGAGTLLPVTWSEGEIPYLLQPEIQYAIVQRVAEDALETWHYSIFYSVENIDYGLGHEGCFDCDAVDGTFLFLIDGPDAPSPSTDVATSSIEQTQQNIYFMYLVFLSTFWIIIWFFKR